jgi:predicted membrane-bound mannosyltransferase
MYTIYATKAKTDLISSSAFTSHLFFCFWQSVSHQAVSSIKYLTVKLKILLLLASRYLLSSGPRRHVERTQTVGNRSRGARIR